MPGLQRERYIVCHIQIQLHLYVHLQVPLNYLSNPSISLEDKTIEHKLADEQHDLSGNRQNKINLLIIYFYIFRNPSAGTNYNQSLSTKVTDLDSSFSNYGRHWPWNHSWEFGDDFCHTRQSAPVTKTQNLPNLRDGFGKITLHQTLQQNSLDCRGKGKLIVIF